MFYGFGDARTPMYISIANLAANVACNFVFIHYFGIKGLALTTSVSTMLSFVLRLILIRKHVTLAYGDIIITFLKVLFAGAVSCMLPWFLLSRIDCPLLLELLIAAASAVLLYAGLVFLLKISEIKDLLQILTKKLNRKKK